MKTEKTLRGITDKQLGDILMNHAKILRGMDAWAAKKNRQVRNLFVGLGLAFLLILILLGLQAGVL